MSTDWPVRDHGTSPKSLGIDTSARQPKRAGSEPSTDSPQVPQTPASRITPSRVVVGSGTYRLSSAVNVSKSRV